MCKFTSFRVWKVVSKSTYAFMLVLLIRKVERHFYVTVNRNHYSQNIRRITPGPFSTSLFSKGTAESGMWCWGPGFLDMMGSVQIAHISSEGR